MDILQKSLKLRYMHNADITITVIVQIIKNRKILIIPKNP